MALPKILEQGKTPAEWVAIFEERGLELSERKLRTKARSLGAYCALGNTMLIKPEHIDRIFEEEACRSKSTSEETATGSADELMGLTATLSEASEHLTSKLQPQKSRKSNGKRGNVRSLDQMRRQKQTS